VGRDYFDPDAYLSYLFYSSVNIWGLNDTRIDELITTGMTTNDQNIRINVYHEAQDRIYEIKPCIFLAAPTEYDCVRYNVRTGSTSSPI